MILFQTHSVFVEETFIEKNAQMDNSLGSDGESNKESDGDEVGKYP